MRKRGADLAVGYGGACEIATVLILERYDRDREIATGARSEVNAIVPISTQAGIPGRLTTRRYGDSDDAYDLSKALSFINSGCARRSSEHPLRDPECRRC
jgi:hypothetical protein